jgi:hypothetical protein
MEGIGLVKRKRKNKKDSGTYGFRAEGSAGRGTEGPEGRQLALLNSNQGSNVLVSFVPIRDHTYSFL